MSHGGAFGSSPSWWVHATAAVAYLAIALWSMSSLAGRHDTHVLLRELTAAKHWNAVIEHDQRATSATIASNAQTLLRSPLEVGERGGCYPFPRPFTLGEHLFGEGILGVLPWAWTRNPISTTNAVGLLSTWILAMATYALAFHFTRSPLGSLLAGIVVGFHPARMVNPAHPMVHGNLWTPLALLFAHRLFTERRWRDAIALGAFVSLQLLESFYQVLGLTILGGTYGVSLLLHHRASLVPLLPKLSLVALISAATVWIVLVPYLETRTTWPVLSGRNTPILFATPDFLPGRRGGVGWLPFALGIAGLLDRLRGRRGPRGDDPRLALAAGGILALWCSVYSIWVPGLGWKLSSPVVSLRDVLPGLDAIRVPASIRFNVYLVVGVLAAYGVVALTERLTRSARTWVQAALAAGALAEVCRPELAKAGYGVHLNVATRRLAPAFDVDHLRSLVPDGPVLDLPFPRKGNLGALTQVSTYALLGGYHGQPVAACYGSFANPLDEEIAAFAERLPDDAAADELHAIGFRTLLLHHDYAGPRQRERFEQLARGGRTTRPLGGVGPIVALALESERPTQSSRTLLADPPPHEGSIVAAPPPHEGSIVAAPPRAKVQMPFHNRTEFTYRQDPIEPVWLVARWRRTSVGARDLDGGIAREDRVRVLLPLALAAGSSVHRRIEVDVPAQPGSYVLELASVDEPTLVLSRRAVEVR